MLQHGLRRVAVHELDGEIGGAAEVEDGRQQRLGLRVDLGRGYTAAKAHALTCLLVEISTAPRTRSREVAGDAEGRCQGAAGV